MSVTIEYYKKHKRKPYKTDYDSVRWLNIESAFDTAFIALDKIADEGDRVIVSDTYKPSISYKFRVISWGETFGLSLLGSSWCRKS